MRGGGDPVLIALLPPRSSVRSLIKLSIIHKIVFKYFYFNTIAIIKHVLPHNMLANHGSKETVLPNG